MKMKGAYFSYFFNVATSKFLMTLVAYMKFLLPSTVAHPACLAPGSCATSLMSGNLRN
jgi:hypothetical protein